MTHAVQSIGNGSKSLYEELKSYGGRLGYHAYKQNKEYLLYRLKSCRKKEQLLELLVLVQFLLDITVSDTILNALTNDEGQWYTIKTLLCIHAMNANLRAKRKDEANSSEEKGESHSVTKTV